MLTGTRSFSSNEGWQWHVDFDRLLVAGSSTIATRASQRCFDFNRPLGDEATEYLWAHGPGAPASTTTIIGWALERFCAFLGRTGRRGFTAEAFSAWLAEMQEEGLRESTRRSAATQVRTWANTWLHGRGIVTEPDLITVDRRFLRHFRGFRRRNEERLREQYVTPDEWVRLLRAIRMELEYCRRLLEDSTLVPAHPGMPLMPFVLLAGALLAVRPAEVNAMNVGDFRIRNNEHQIYLHAPNKAPGYLPVGEVVKEAWDVAEAWMRRYRADPQPGEPLLVVLPEGHDRPVRLDTIWVNGILKIFYRKYFRTYERDGRPVLYWQRDAQRHPCPLSIGHYRSAAITEKRRHERNPEKLRVFARHASVQTTLGYYVRLQHLEWVDDITQAYRAGAEQARMARPLPIATVDERATADGAGAILPGGICGLALQGRPCPLSRDCMRCRFFKLHPDYRQYFVREFTRECELARQATLDDGLKRDTQIHEARCALLQACIDRIDDHFADLREPA